MNYNSIKNKIKDRYNNSFDVKFNDFNKKIHLIYIVSICDSNIINETILKNIVINKDFDSIKDIITNCNTIDIKSIDDIYNYLENGFCIVCYNNDIVAVETKKNLSRSISEPTMEQTINGPKDSLNEDYMTNIGLIRKRIKDETLTMIEKKVGKKSKTKVNIMYLDNIVENSLVDEIIKKIDNLDLEYVLDSSFISQSIISNNNVFPLAETSERPDLICKSLLEGKVCLIVENSPFAIIVPTFFVDLFHSPEDYYQPPLNVTFTRLIRLLAFYIAIVLPAFYIAITTFNHETIPLTLIINFAAQRNGVPFPTFIEALGMIIIFEILRESDLRMPSISGNAISILGAIVLGDAAVSAGIVSPIMVIIIAISSICSLMFSNVAMINAIRLWKIIFLIFASFLGIVGLVFASFLFIIIMSSLKSFGKPYLYPIAPLGKSKIKDSFIVPKVSKLKQDPILAKDEVIE